jgi:hypothetical protein
MFNLKKKFILAWIEALKLSNRKEQYSEGKYQQWKRNLAFTIKNNTIDWNTHKAIF